MTKKRDIAEAYLVVASTSTRRTLDPDAPDYNEWVDFAPESIVSDWPAHAPIDEWVASGHWLPVAADKEP